MKIFSLFDTRAQTYAQPFADSSTVNAPRGFDTAVNAKDSTLSRYPDDFSLMELATFDPQTGQLVPLVSPLNLGTARTVLRQPTLPGMGELREAARG